MSHGGAAPQLRCKANERLLQGVPKMLTELKRLATDESMPPSVTLAIRDWLDLAGIAEAMEAEVTVNAPWQEVLGEVFTQFDAGDETITLSPDDGAYAPDEKDARWEGMLRRQPTGDPRPADPLRHGVAARTSGSPTRRATPASRTLTSPGRQPNGHAAFFTPQTPIRG